MCNINQVNESIVPPSHNFGISVCDYLEYRQAGHEPNNIQSFREWLIDNPEKGINTDSSARSHSYSLGVNLCNIINLSLDQLTQLANHPESFEAGKIIRVLVPNDINDAPRVIKCAFVVGLCNQAQLSGAEFITEAKNRGWAGKKTDNPANPAQAILSLGRSFLRHCKLVDENDMPNSKFALLFRC